MEEEIPEPLLDASSFDFVSVNSPEIKQHYKMMYPEQYCTNPMAVMEQLDEEETFNKLQNSVASFIRHLKQTSQQMTFGYFVSENESENSADNEESEYEMEINQPVNISKISTPTSNFSIYDSVHSVKIPLRTYERKSSHPYQHKEQEDKKVTELAQKMKGLVFERVEKSIHFSVEFGKIPSTSQRNKPITLPKMSRKQSKVQGKEKKA